MKNRQINNLEDLQKVKRQYAAKRKIAWKEFDNQLDVIQHDAASYLVKKVVLPVGVGMLSTYLIKSFVSSWTGGGKGRLPASIKGEVEQAFKKSSPKSHWVKYLSIMLSLYKIYQSVSNKKSDAQPEQVARVETSAPASPKEFIRNFKSQGVQHSTSGPAANS